MLTGVHPFAGDPFLPRSDLEVVGDELRVGTDQFPARLRRAIAAPTFLALRSQRELDDRIEVTDGWELPLSSPSRDSPPWWDVANAADLVYSGLEFVLTDSTATWAILVVPGAQLVAGDRRFTQAYFGDDTRAGDKVVGEMVPSPVNSPDRQAEFRGLGDHLRLRASSN